MKNAENIVYSRNTYLAKIKPFIGAPTIKVLTGMRRSGKSFLLRQIMRELPRHGIPKRNIVFVDKEDYAFDAIRDYHDLAAFADKALASAKGRAAICVDEIQDIAGWERIVASWAAKGREVFITGSNARMLSADLMAQLAGRYVKFEVRPLSFAEFLDFRGKPAEPDDAEFQTYLRYGGLPGLHAFATLDDTTFRPFAQSIFDTILLKDIVARNGVRNVALLERVARFVMDNTGNLTNATRIATFLKSERINISVDTIRSYLHWFTEARLTERTLIFDIKGKRHLTTNEKHYPIDFGLKHAVLRWRPDDIAGLLENVVFLELRRRGWTVSTGRVGEWEVDFVGERNGERAYWQVCTQLGTEKLVERETRSLIAIEDAYPKQILTLDKYAVGDHNGIACHWLPQWLLGE